MKTLYDTGEDLYENIDGTPFLSDEFLPGDIYMRSGEVYSGDFRYDIYADQVQFKGENMIYCIAFPEDIVSVKIGDIILKYLSNADNKKASEGYLINLTDGYYSLYMKLNKTLNPPVSVKPYQPEEPGKFVDKDEYYFIGIGDTPILRVKGKREVIEMFPGKEKLVKDFIDREGIKTNNRNDLIRLVTFLNSD